MLFFNWSMCCTLIVSHCMCVKISKKKLPQIFISHLNVLQPLRIHICHQNSTFFIHAKFLVNRSGCKWDLLPLKGDFIIRKACGLLLMCNYNSQNSV